MQEAEITSFLRTIFIIFLVYYGFKLFAKYLAPFLLKRAATKFEEKVRNKQKPRDPEGEVGETIIAKTAGSKKTSNDSVGEYVDYEEVE
jgi:hypothetical protein